MEVDRSLRKARAAVFAVACVGVSAGGHVWMSGSSIPAWALLAALLACGAAGYAAAGRQRGFLPIAGLMLAGELGLHLLFTVAQHAAGGAASMASSMANMPGMQGMPSMPGMVMPSPSPEAAWMSGHGSAGMIAVHVLAGLLCAWWLRRGEAAVFRLLRILAQFAMPLLLVVWRVAPAAADFTCRVPDDRDEHAPSGRRLLVHAVVRRGPPVPVFCM